ncbi:MAG: sigma-70 family RNA polymerase sigma factor [Pirellulaceae bacterium]|nr:sigma-70 family RNA polymerase sigma factor [Pirellulaceae bacterium]
MTESPDTRPSLLLRLAEPADQVAWEDFVQIYEPVVVRMAMRRGLQASDAHDLCQEVMTRVARTIANWNPDRERGSFRSWLATVTRNLVIDHFRKQQRRPSLPGESALADINAPAEQALFEQEEERQIFCWAADRARQSFTDTTWQAFWLTCVENQSPQAVAEQLELSVGAVYIARSRVLAKIKEVVQQMEGTSVNLQRLGGPTREN